MPIPPLIDISNGHYNVLPPGVHSCNLSEVHSTFCTNKHRKSLLDNLHKYIDHLSQHLQINTIFLDGSFTTGKGNPGDIDLIIPIVRDDFLDTDKALFISKNFPGGNGVKYNTNHAFPMFEGYEQSLDQIWDYFTCDRFLPQVEKGILCVRVK